MQKPHFVQDYQRLARNMLRRHEREAALLLSSGGGGYVHGDAELAMLETLGLGPGHRVVEVGCGAGRLAYALRAVPGASYLGTDVVPEHIEFARERCKDLGWRLELVDGLTIPEQSASADFIVFISVLTHLTRAEGLAYLLDAKRVLKPTGKIVVTFLDPAVISTKLLVAVVGSRLKRLFISGGIFSALATKGAMRRLGVRAGLVATFPGYHKLGQNVCVFSHQTPETSAASWNSTSRTAA
jgi:SAM-dependent methyltransferase